MRAYHLLDRMRRRHSVTLACFYRNREEREGLQWLAEKGWDVVPVPFARPGLLQPKTWGSLARYLRARVGQLPAGVVHWQQGAMRRSLSRLWEEADVVEASNSYLAPYLGSQPSRFVRVATALDVFSVTLSRRLVLPGASAAAHGTSRELRRYRSFESQIGRWADTVIAMSEADRSALKVLDSSLPVEVIPNGVDTGALVPGEVRESGRQVLFVGSPDHPPNVDAACWLLEEIWPLVLQAMPDARLTLVNMDTNLVRKMSAGLAGIHLTGRVPDVVPYYREADLCLVPLRIGSGTRLKILEAMALGLPVLSTTIGVEGLAVTDGQELIIRDSGDSLAQASVELLGDTNRRRSLSVAARVQVMRRYDWEQIVNELDTLYTGLVLRHLDRPTIG